MRSNSTTLDLNDPSLPGANAGPTDPVQVMPVFNSGKVQWEADALTPRKQTKAMHPKF